MTLTWSKLLNKNARLDKPWLILPGPSRAPSDHRTISFAALRDSALRAARALHQISRGDALRVVLVADSSPECAICIFAVLSSGLVLVPAAPPPLGQPSHGWRANLDKVIDACAPAVVVGNEADLREVRPRPGIHACSFERLLAHAADGSVDAASLDDRSIALWQGTSGTTSGSRTVMLSHANIFANVEAIGRRINVSESDRGATWLPLFHDMGLIGSLLFSAFWGIPLVLLKPRAFIARPEAWLWAIDRFKVTCSAAPSSAYEVCATKVMASKVQGLDLSSWRVAFNGAEQIHAATLDRFCQRYAAHGFRREAMYPVYGLAEHTVAATLPEVTRCPEVDWIDSTELAVSGRAVPRATATEESRCPIVSVGRVLPGHAMRVVADDGASLPDRHVGEIELTGPSQMCGYRDPAPGACVTSDGWLRTGDLGYLANGSLFVVGRRKHIIKRGGATIDAATVEGNVRMLPSVRSVAVFGVPDPVQGSERLVVQVEVARLSAEDENLLRRGVATVVREAIGCVPDVIELVSPGFIPRTTSGKVQHTVARAKYLGEAR